MPATPFTSVIKPQNPFIGESIDIAVSFDNIGDIPGYGPFALLYLDSTGADGNDGLTFDSATYLGSSVKIQEVTLDGSGFATINVFGVEQTIAVPSDFGANDTLVLLELPYGSFVPNQPQVDLTVKLNGSNLADVGTPMTIMAQEEMEFLLLGVY
ncbi:MAG: hypothetical protein QNJ41_07755 [Xenococcaceae cyanobacterium MO_188.B32]|nr:hypothetical protein [Xenococcaceae cyanobacterium MO_188.B32]